MCKELCLVFLGHSGHLVLSLPPKNTTVTVGFAPSFSGICFNSTLQKHSSKSSSNSKYFWKEGGCEHSPTQVIVYEFAEKLWSVLVSVLQM